MATNRRDVGVFLIGFLTGAVGVGPFVHFCYWLVIIGMAVAFHFFK